MPRFGDIVQKAFYLGVGLAAYASEKAGEKLAELRSQLEKLAEEMVARGEMNTEEARRFVEDMMRQAQQPQSSVETTEKTAPSEPRRINISDEEYEEPAVKEAPKENVKNLRQQVIDLRTQLEQLKHHQ
jgi:polyhydroxyalkanoate synthesis regulator phasin